MLFIPLPHEQGTPVRVEVRNEAGFRGGPRGPAKPYSRLCPRVPGTGFCSRTMDAPGESTLMTDRLPNAISALVDERKLSDCLLNPTHPDNGGKAAFFLGLGFGRSSPSTLRSALLSLAAEGALTRRVVSAHGTKFVVDGVLRSPDGKEAVVRTVWIADTGFRHAASCDRVSKRRQVRL